MPSARENLEAKERREWIANYEAAEREKEDRKEYARYQAKLTASGFPMLSYEKWRSLMPTDEPNPAIRGDIATHQSLWNEKAKQEKAIVAGKSRPLEDYELSGLGFDLNPRVNWNRPGNDEANLKAEFAEFEKQTPSFDSELHFDAVIGFLKRNRLKPNVTNITLAFALLLGMWVIEPKPPEPEPEPRNPDLNEHGVNLHVRPDPEFERRKREEDYRKKIVAVDPRNLTAYTEYMLDRLPAEEYRRLVFGEFGVPKITNVIQPR